MASKFVKAITAVAIACWLVANSALAQSNPHLYINSRQHYSEIIDNGDAPVPGATVTITGPDIGTVTAVTDDRGWVGFDIKPNSYFVRVEGGEFTPEAEIVRIELAHPLKPGFYLHDGEIDLYRRWGLGLRFLLQTPRFEVRVAQGAAAIIMSRPILLLRRDEFLRP